jgi:hypothetical protein
MFNEYDLLRERYKIDFEEYEKQKHSIYYLNNLIQKINHAIFDTTKEERKKMKKFYEDRQLRETAEIKNFENCFNSLYNNSTTTKQTEIFKTLFNSYKHKKLIDILLKLQERKKKTSIQSILFDKNIFKTKQQCVSWIKKQNKEKAGRTYDFKYGKYDPPDTPTQKYHRFRQFPPNPNKQYRISSEIDTGVKFIYEF